MSGKRGVTTIPKSEEGDPSRGGEGAEPSRDRPGTGPAPDGAPAPEGSLGAEPGEGAAPERLAADLQELRDLLEAGRVAEARRFVQELAQRWPEAERVQHYARVLEPPKVRMRPDIPARSREREWKWLEEHGREYPGCWLAIDGDQLIAADPDRALVRAKAAQVLGGKPYLLIHQPGSASTK